MSTAQKTMEPSKWALARTSHGHFIASGAGMCAYCNQTAIEFDAIRREAVEKWERALVGLTPGGSEFVGNPEECAQFIRARMATVIRLQKRVMAAEKVAVAASKVHHWHDWGKDNEGMVVSADSVRDLWESLDAFRETREDDAEPSKQDAAYWWKRFNGSDTGRGTVEVTYGTLQEFESAIRQERDGEAARSHCPTCNSIAPEIGGPGCSCAPPMPAVVLKQEREVAEKLANTVEEYYPTIAGRVIQLREAGEDNAAAKWSEITTAFRSALAEFRKGKGE